MFWCQAHRPDANQPNSRAADEGTQVRTILQNIAVLSAGTDIQKDAEGKPKPVQVVNLLVTPDQAEVLSLASGAKIQLVLRNPLDTKTDPVQGTAMLNLFTGGKPAPVPVKHIAAAPKAPAPKPFSVEVINGTKHTEQNLVLPRQSSESERWQNDRIFLRIVCFALRRFGPEGPGACCAACCCGQSGLEQ